MSLQWSHKTYLAITSTLSLCPVQCTKCINIDHEQHPNYSSTAYLEHCHTKQEMLHISSDDINNPCNLQCKLLTYHSNRGACTSQNLGKQRAGECSSNAEALFSFETVASHKFKNGAAFILVLALAQQSARDATELVHSPGCSSHSQEPQVHQPRAQIISINATAALAALPGNTSKPRQSPPTSPSSFWSHMRSVHMLITLMMTPDQALHSPQKPERLP